MNVLKWKYHLLWILFFDAVAFMLHAQVFQCSGIVTDAETGKPLPFVNVVVNESRTGTVTDIDGRFTIRLEHPLQQLRFSYVGYEIKTIDLREHSCPLTIAMHRTAVELQEIIVHAGENPALRIIRNVINHRDQHHPEKYRSFSYTSYDRLVVTVDTTVGSIMEDFPADSTEIRLKKFLRDKDFFLIESVVERKFQAPSVNQEKVLAKRISGIRDPLFVFLSSQLQSPSFYDDLIKIGDKLYINPISEGGFPKYTFRLEDSFETPHHDSIFIISFRQRENTHFDGLQGVLTINSQGWAIQNVTAEPCHPEERIHFRISQMHELIDSMYWFPVQLTTEITFRSIKFGRYSPVGIARSYLQEIVIDPDRPRKRFGTSRIEMDPLAHRRDEDFWFIYRGDSLSPRDRRTYQFIDSIAAARNLEKRINLFRKLLNQKIPLGYVDLDIQKLGYFNQYEGLSLGLGGFTSKKLSGIVFLGGFVNYGFRDKSVKYGVEGNLRFDRNNNAGLRAGYYDFVLESGGMMFHDQGGRWLDPASLRMIYIRRMDRVRRLSGGIYLNRIRNIQLWTEWRTDSKIPPFDYQFDDGRLNVPVGNPIAPFNFTELRFGMNVAFKEKAIQIGDEKIVLTPSPAKLRLAYTRGLSSVWGGRWNYHKLEMRTDIRKYFRFVGESNLVLAGGWVDRPVPFVNLFNGEGSYESLGIYVSESFLTMRPNEFLSDRYLFAFFTHDFGSLLFGRKKFVPEIALVTNVGVGSLKHPEYHRNIDFQMMNKIYFESGILLNNMLKLMRFYSFGIGMFYRYGYYQFPGIRDNLTFRINMEFEF